MQTTVWLTKLCFALLLISLSQVFALITNNSSGSEIQMRTADTNKGGESVSEVSIPQSDDSPTFATDFTKSTQSASHTETNFTNNSAVLTQSLNPANPLTTQNLENCNPKSDSACVSLGTDSATGKYKDIMETAVMPAYSTSKNDGLVKSGITHRYDTATRAYRGTEDATGYTKVMPRNAVTGIVTGPGYVTEAPVTTRAQSTAVEKGRADMAADTFITRPSDLTSKTSDGETSSVPDMILTSQQTTSSTFGHHLLSTDDFIQCFRSPVSRYFSTDLYANITAFSGSFELLAQDAERINMRICTVGISVPSGMIIVFELVNIHLKCGEASFIIYQSTSGLLINDKYTYCGTSVEGLPKNIFILSSGARVSLSLWRFAPDHAMRFTFTALPFSARPRLNVTRISGRLGMFFKPYSYFLPCLQVFTGSLSLRLIDFIS